jgi:hypothetical protein
MTTPAAEDALAINARLKRLEREASYRHVDPADLHDTDLDDLAEFLDLKRQGFESDLALRLRVVQALATWRGAA